MIYGQTVEEAAVRAQNEGHTGLFSSACGSKTANAMTIAAAAPMQLAGQ